VTCFTKDNIMKLTDGLFHKVFDEIAAEYPDIENEHWIVDIGAAKLADTPEAFDVIVMPNLYGDILSDVAAQIAGSVGLAGSANIGDACAMFEAIHGSAPRRAGQNLANPSGLFLGAVQMLVHIGQAGVAELAHNAWLKTIEDGIHTYDIFDERVSKQKVGTKEFADAVVARIGKKPEVLKQVDYSKALAKPLNSRPPYVRSTEKREMVGADVFCEFKGSPDDLAAKLQPLAGDGMGLEMLSNRGMKVWPGGLAETFTVDVYRCRFQLPEGTPGAVSHKAITALLNRITDAGVEFVKLEGLYNFDGKPGFSRGQGQ
ncbi:MAG: isocitrate/isopropylmalate family dehydrogenase, partial [Pirellula sp.]